MTFSIVARDPETRAVGVAVQSKFISVGAVVPFAAADARAALEEFRGMNNFENHTLPVIEDALARGWDEADGTGEDRLVDALWHGLSRLDRV